MGLPPRLRPAVGSPARGLSLQQVPHLRVKGRLSLNTLKYKPEISIYLAFSSGPVSLPIVQTPMFLGWGSGIAFRGGINVPPHLQAAGLSMQRNTIESNRLMLSLQLERPRLSQVTTLGQGSCFAALDYKFSGAFWLGPDLPFVLEELDRAWKL